MHIVAVYSANMAKLPRSKVSLHSRATGERGRHGKAPCGHFAMSGVFDYPYTFISILLSVLLYIYIAILLYWCIDVLLYCLISTLLYICIVILFYISIVYNKAIYIFLYLYFCFRFLCSTSIFLA